MPIDVLSFAYAATVAAGGIVGYVKAGEISSKLVEGHSYEVGDSGSYYNELLFYDA
jgi:Transmembrane proteins 14C.